MNDSGVHPKDAVIPATDPVVIELSPCPDVIDSLRSCADSPDVILFHSSLTREHVGRYSFLAAEPFAVFEIAAPQFGTDPFAEIRGLVNRFSTTSVDGLPPFQGGVAGMLGYALGGIWERLPNAPIDEFRLPAMTVGVYDRVVAWDHESDRAWIISHGFPEVDRDARRHRAESRANELRDRIVKSNSPQAGVRSHSVSTVSRVPGIEVAELATQHPAPGLDGLTSNFSRDEYLRAVDRVVEYIRAGDIFQANLSQRLLFPQRCDSLDLFERLSQRNRAPFSAYFAHEDWAIASASPERFLRVSGRDVETRPIKGTRRRRSVPEADLFTRDELRESDKDQAENVMIVDLLRNDLSRVCAPGSIRVPELCRVESYETVQHLVSEVRGQLAPGHDVWDLLRATFPGGSITGAPKVRAMEIIAELEPTARGPYCGSLFYSGFDGEFDSSILIRTLICRHGWIQCQAGGGIVAQSNAIAEYEETLHKAEGMLRALV